MTSDKQQQEAPAVFKTWGRFYLFVLGLMIFLIILFYLFTRAFA